MVDLLIMPALSVSSLHEVTNTRILAVAHLLPLITDYFVRSEKKADVRPERDTELTTGIFNCNACLCFLVKTKSS